MSAGDDHHHVPAGELDERAVQQEHELEALAAIYGDDFQDIRTKQPWKVKRPPEVYLSLHPKGLECGQESYVKVDLEVKCPPTYPDVSPHLELKNAKGLSNENLQNLQAELTKLAAARCGEVMIFELADFVQSFLSEHNVPPPRSFHEEMLKNHQRQQERLAKEQQQRMDLQRQQEEQMQNEILAEIQRREEEKREEKKRKEIAKQVSALIYCLLGYLFLIKLKVRASSFNCLLRKRKSINVLFSSTGESETLGRSVYNAFVASTGSFAVVYEWTLRWKMKLGKFLTNQEKEKIEKCKKQIQGAESELNSLLKLEHPHLVHYMALSHRELEDCLVVDLLAEHVAGYSLAHTLTRGTPLPVDRLRQLAAQLLAALDYLHSNSVVHKKLTASSVLLDADGNLRLTDYSLSKRLADVCKEDVFEQVHVRFSEDTIPTKTGKKGDIWSMGLLLLALSQGAEVREYPVSVPSNLPTDFQDFLNRCVCLNDAERWNTQQLLGHSFFKPPSPRTPLHCQDDNAGDDFASTIFPRNRNLNAPFSTEIQKQFSRYYNEFEELKLLGKGAFGAVIKVQNKLDGCYYAVKRIQVNPSSKQFRRIKGEVTLLSRLNHENIVRYYNAWIERHEKPSSPRHESRKRNELDMPDDVEAEAPPPTLASSVEWSTSIERSSSAKCSGADLDSSDEDDEEEDVFCPSFLPCSSDSESDIIFDNGDGSRDSLSPENDEKSKGKEAATAESTDTECLLLVAHYLYIQMEYCEKSTLRDTIDKGLYLDSSRLWRLFREILDGLAYIHEQVSCLLEKAFLSWSPPHQGMIHRDLKPVNIFLDSLDHVKIGDFDNMTGMVGTALYVSPEVQGNTKATYNQKVDLFSLGIILFEMSYRPMTTTSERITVLSQLRKDSIEFPDDFHEYAIGPQRKVISWLLNHDPAMRPTAQELLKSDLLPPPQMEESELHEVLQLTMANVHGKAYRTMVNQLFSQSISPVMDYTYDIDVYKGSFNVNSVKLQQYVYETITRIFKKHGAVRLQTPLLMPKNRTLYEGSELACFMDHSGMLVTLPYDLRVSFARYLARNNVSALKRYCIERVFRPRRLDRAHPRELLECAFDIVTPATNSLFPDAEVIYTISEIIQEFASLQERNYCVYLNHTSLLRAMLLHSGVPEDKLLQASIILCDAMTEKLTRREVEAKFCNLSLSTNSCRPFNCSLNILPSDARASKTCLCLGIQVVVNLGLIYKVQHHCGVIFQFVAFVHRRRRTVADIIAAGGRYDHLITEFCGPGSLAPVRSAVGASLAIDKVCAVLASMEEPVSDSCDVMVVPMGQNSMDRAINVIQKLWSTGVSADIVYDASQEAVLEQCRQAGITCVALVSDKEGNYIRVKSFEKDRQSEKRIPETDLVDHIVQKCRTKFYEERNNREMCDSVSLQNTKGSLLATSGSLEPHGSSAAMNVNLITPEKVSASTRRRYETQVLKPNLYREFRYCAVDLPKETLINFLSLEEQFNVSVKHLLSRLPKQRYLKCICEEIHRFKIAKQYVTYYQRVFFFCGHQM
uniref:non-specific serine/threonine protein kinase n=1 Tax=Scleropages formosus TaxID=113540 RepID=A0A8C9V9M8_SCLFO